MLSVYLKGRRKDENVIEVHKDKLVKSCLPAPLLTMPWKTAGAFVSPNGRDQIFVVSRGGIEGCLPLIALTNTNKMVGVAEV